MRPSGLGGFSGRRVFGHSWQWTLFAALLLSWGMMNIIAAAIEHRTLLLDPSGEYKAFYYGDLICLPAMALAIWYLGHYMPTPNLSEKAWWHWLCFLAGIGFGLGLHLWEASNHVYTRSQDFSPTKLYHDFVVFPCYIYILASAGLPVAFRSKGGWKAKLVLWGFFAAFLLLNLYDNFHKPHHMHINFNWRTFSPG